MPRQEDDLLARLNALKPSSVTLGSAVPQAEHGEKSQTVSDQLADRLKQLRAGTIGTVKVPGDVVIKTEKPNPRPFEDDERIEQPESDPVRDWNDNEQSIEELLAELGPDDQWELDPDDPKHIDSLLQEAKATLPREPGHSGNERAPLDEFDANNPTKASQFELSDETGQDAGDSVDRGADQEADEYVKRILAELELESKYGVVDKEDSTSTDQQEENKSDPETPSNVPQQSALAKSSSTEDTELEARFSKLGLSLPSAPSTAPSTQAKSIKKAGMSNQKKVGANSNLPTYTDTDIDSWCCICNEDGEVKCLGCDGDIYCQTCWNEGHGDGPGQERGHRAVQYNRKGPAVVAG